MKNYWKNALLRGLIGIPVGIALASVIGIFISLADLEPGTYLPCAPAFIEHTGSELHAVVIQTVICAALGAIYCASSVIFEVDEWGMTLATILHFIVIAGSLIPSAYILFWMERSTRGILLYIALAVGIYAVLWVIQFIYWKRKIRRLNGTYQGE